MSALIFCAAVVAASSVVIAIACVVGASRLASVPELVAAVNRMALVLQRNTERVEAAGKVAEGAGVGVRALIAVSDEERRERERERRRSRSGVEGPTSYRGAADGEPLAASGGVEGKAVVG